MLRSAGNLLSLRCPAPLTIPLLYGFWYSALVLNAPVRADDPAGPQPKLIQSIGFGETWKLGQPCNVRIRLPSALADKVAFVEITTVDGDAVEVVYRHPWKPDSIEHVSTPSTIDVPIRIGRRQSVLSVRLMDADNQVIASEDRELTSADGLPPTQPLIVAIGSSMGVEELVRSSADGAQQSIHVVVLNDAEMLPRSPLEYLPVDLLVLATADIELLKSIDSTRWAAIDQWIRAGGGCIISLGAPSAQLNEIKQLNAFLPGRLEGDGQIRNPAALESLVSADQPLQPFPSVIVQATDGKARLNLSDNLGNRSNWWVTASHGFGTLHVVASDLGHSSFANWKHRRLIWEKLVEPYFDKSIVDGSKISQKGNANSYLGYDDLTGQLRATLEQFPGVTVISFSQVAALLIAILLLIGPVDYLVSVRWLNRPYMSWVFSGAVLIASSLGLAWYYRSLRPDKIMVNSVNLIDMDAQTGTVFGHHWEHIYSARARQVSVEAQSTLAGSQVRLDWQGLPGGGLGGLESQMRLERGMPAYGVTSMPNGSGGSAIESVGIPAAGTKALYGVWSEHLPTLLEDGNRSSLREMASVDHLEGELINPLDVDLRDAMVIYHRWFYWLKSRMPAGDRVVFSSQVIPRDVSRRLNRQTEVDGKVSSAQWNPADRKDLDRLLELMMFHKSATGQNYTSLTHRYQPIIDHSNLLETDYAILVGRLDSPATKVEVKADQSDVAVEAGDERTWVRILIKVDSSTKKK